MPLSLLMRLSIKLLKGRRSKKNLNFWLLYTLTWKRWRNVHRACLLIGNNLKRFPKETLEGHSFSLDLSALLSNGDLSYFGDLFLPFNMNPRPQLLEWSREWELLMHSGPNALLHLSSLPWYTRDIDQIFLNCIKLKKEKKKCVVHMHSHAQV